MRELYQAAAKGRDPGGRAAYPDGESFRPEDVATTIYSLLGVDVDHTYNDHLGRPWKIATGSPIRKLLT